MAVSDPQYQLKYDIFTLQDTKLAPRAHSRLEAKVIYGSRVWALTAVGVVVAGR